MAFFVSQTAKFVKEAYQTVSKALMNLFELIKVGGQKLQSFVEDIWRKIADWFVKNRKTANAVDWMSSKLFKFGDDDRTFRNFLKLRQRATDEFYNVLCHGEPDRIIINGRKLKAEEFAKMLLEQGYEKGKPIRLISCHTGVKQNGFASKLAKLLETKVIAPTDRISLNDLGEFIIDKKGKFVEFNK